MSTSFNDTGVEAEEHVAQGNSGQEDEDIGNEEDSLIPINTGHSSYSELLRAASLQQAQIASQPLIGHEVTQAAWFEQLDAYFKWPDARFLTPLDEESSRANIDEELEDDGYVRTFFSLIDVQMECRPAHFVSVCNTARDSRLQDIDRRAGLLAQLWAAEGACSGECTWSVDCFTHTVLFKGRLCAIIDLQTSVGILSALFPIALAVACIRSVISGFFLLAIAAAFLVLLTACFLFRSRVALKEAALLIDASRAYHLHSGLAALLYSGLAWSFLSMPVPTSSASALLFYIWSSELLLTFESASIARKAAHAWNPLLFQLPRSFHAIIFASIIIPPLYLLRLLVISTRRFHPNVLLAFLERFLEPASPFAVIHATMTGEPCWHAGRSASRLLRRNLLPNATASPTLQALAWPLLTIPLLMHTPALLGEWLRVYTLFTLLRFYYRPIVTSIDVSYWCYAAESDDVETPQSVISPSISHTRSGSSNEALARLFAAKQARGFVYPLLTPINKRHPLC